MTDDHSGPILSSLILSLGFLIVLLGVLFAYMWFLQYRYYTTCKEQNNLILFSQSPAGLPVGTIRSVLALLIVIVGLSLTIVSIFSGKPTPETITALLGTIIGFYFGSRSSGGGGGDQEGQVREMQAQRDEAVKDKATGDANTLIGKIQKGVEITRMVADILPQEQRDQFTGVAGKLEQGLEVAQQLSDGKPVEAVAKAAEVLNVFQNENPLKAVVVRALGSFGSVLPASMPPLALITAVVGVTATVIGVTYQRWRARILDLPFSPAAIPPVVIDANTGFSLIVQCPTLKQAFTQELEKNDRPFMADLVKNFLEQGDLEALWKQYAKHFESRQTFEMGVEEFRRVAADFDLRDKVNPAIVAPVGGYDKAVAAVQEIHKNDQATADLDALVLSVEAIKKNGGSPKEAFDDVLKEVK